ncbi:DUF4907 domain-containing protein [Pontimicrobium sp. IMCC45349]|uniref:DUF4907 domain-containing protein n=1 Tax=Pontimicrobium sp. IMCC45349 TaxID=3391574 RepID=UPI00399FFDD4
MTKKTVLITSIVLAITLTVIILYPKKQSLTYSIHKTNNGYGYTIQENNKILIKQNNIPAIEKSNSFCSKKEAKKTAKLVISKLNSNKPPTITTKELTTLGISFNCVNLP